MDRVFPKNMDPIDKDDEKKAIGTLEDYIRYMKEQIEWAVDVILTLNGGTSLAKAAMDIDRLKTEMSTVRRDADSLSQTVRAQHEELNELSALLLTALKRSDLTTEITEDSDDERIPTAKAVWDLVNGGNGT